MAALHRSGRIGKCRESWRPVSGTRSAVQRHPLEVRWQTRYHIRPASVVSCKERMESGSESLQVSQDDWVRAKEGSRDDGRMA